jgi:4-hydroxy-3-methylbut-2-enyl diphosphate reductase
VRDVLKWLADRGYGDVEPVVSAEESLLFALPKELRRDMKQLSGQKPEKVRHDAAFEDAGSLH